MNECVTLATAMELVSPFASTKSMHGSCASSKISDPFITEQKEDEIVPTEYDITGLEEAHCEVEEATNEGKVTLRAAWLCRC